MSSREIAMPDAAALFNSCWKNDPYPLYAQLRSDNPVARLHDTPYYFISRYADILSVVKSPAVFSSRVPGFLRLQSDGAIAFQSSPESDTAGRILGAEDPPLHTEQRKALSSVFNRRVKQLETQVDQYCTDLTSRLPRNETFDFMRHCARDVPSWAICTLLGMPLSMQAQLAQWAHLVIKLMLGNTSDEAFADSAEAGLGLQVYLHEFLEHAEKNPGDNLTGDLVMLVKAGELQRTTALGMLLQLVVGGADTTASWIGNSLLLLMRNPEQQQALNQGDTLAAMLEETMRLETPSQGNYRIVREEVILGDTTLGEGSILVLLWGAANRDTAVYSDPDNIHLQRQEPQHLGFGRGIHACLGATLARLETRAVYTALTPLMPHIIPEDNIERPAWTESSFSRQLDSLQVRLRI
jgi:cytochrome P450